MTLAVILLSIYALIITALAYTYYHAWNELLQAFNYVTEGDHQWLNDHPPLEITRPETYTTQNPQSVKEYGEELWAGDQPSYGGTT